MTSRLNLPPHLRERTRSTSEEIRQGGEFVVYWSHHALRAHENPALETAASLALQLDLPLLIYQGLGGRHRYNADRHHRFILESARDFGEALTELGLTLCFHLPRSPSSAGPLPGLLRRSAAVVSELYPVPPFTEWYSRHRQDNPDLPWFEVDSSCILPMMHTEKRMTRAFQFRKAYLPELERRSAMSWPGLQRWPEPFRGDPGFEPFDLSGSLSEAIAACEIDHSIPAVADTRGGSRAGYERWSDFLEDGLDHYHRRRNDATQPQAVSRLSPYLHYGCVSPFRVAREALAHGSEGAGKFLDELLIWRELSHHFCFHSRHLETMEALPDWARDSLSEHQIDPRTATLDWETLTRAQSGEPLWDLAQRSLLRRGELHNNVRMTWGKAFLQWTARPQRALKLMIDLNHRYALDGSDPNSYGGILWCLGQFDRAFPPSPVFGKVRQRSIRRHSERLDLNRYSRTVSTPAGGRRLQVGVVGAGLAGLTAARILEDQGHEVVVLEKSRGPGGRMSTRRTGDLEFDHGAQYFTARDPRFLRHVFAWLERGLAAEWSARIASISGQQLLQASNDCPRYVGVPGMSAICSDIAGGLRSVNYRWTLESANHRDGRWQLTSAEGKTLETDALVMTAPPPQARALIGRPELDLALEAVEMRPCWSVMAELDKPLLADWDAAFIDAGPLGWVAGQASRPERPGAHAWVLHARHDWSAQNLDASKEDIAARLMEAAANLPGSNDFDVLGTLAHRWRFALAEQPLADSCLWWEPLGLALAGDWCHGSRIESAFLSGCAAAGRIMAR
jgi:photolyase PhrII